MTIQMGKSYVTENGHVIYVLNSCGTFDNGPLSGHQIFRVFEMGSIDCNSKRRNMLYYTDAGRWTGKVPPKHDVEAVYVAAMDRPPSPCDIVREIDPEKACTSAWDLI